MHYRTTLLECFCFIAANLSCLCHPVRFVHQHLPCDVLWTKRNLKPKQAQCWDIYLPEKTHMIRARDFHLVRGFWGTHEKIRLYIEYRNANSTNGYV